MKGERDMVRNHKVTGTSGSIPVGIAFGVALALLISLAGAAITAYLIDSQMMKQEGIGIAAIIVLAVASACGAILAMLRIKRLRMQMCLLTGLFYYLTLLGMTALFFGGQYQGMGVAALAVLAGSGLVAFLGMREKKIGKMRHKKVAYR